MNIRMLMIAAVGLASLTGCTSTFTGVQRQPDNSLYLTQTKAGPLFVAGSTWHCVPQSETSMRCSRVGVP